MWKVKKICVLFSLMISLGAFAEEIDLEKLNRLFVEQKSGFENVKQGMTYSYLENTINQKEGIECLWHVREVVVQVKNSRYLVYQSRKGVETCEGQMPEHSLEFLHELQWRDIIKAEVAVIELGQRVQISGLEINDNYLAITGKHSCNGSEDLEKYSQIIDITQSQFSNSIFQKSYCLSKTILQRGFIESQNVTDSFLNKAKGY